MKALSCQIGNIVLPGGFRQHTKMVGQTTQADRQRMVATSLRLSHRFVKVLRISICTQPSPRGDHAPVLRRDAAETCLSRP